ncbi:MAG: LysM peptidoglycan-binding domain-containing protein [Treponema sp.]|nr:LysM peptidoglycan-binding domain-containing protein [Treponema sp.]
MKKIGIKLADGAFFPIMEEGQPDKKKINLTTVKDNQTTVQVSLYASESSSMEDAILIDTLKINKLDRQPNGQPDINLSLSLDKNDKIEATLKDESTKEEASFSADLREALLASDKNPGTGKGLLGAAEEIKVKSELDDLSFDIPAFEEGPAPQAETVVDDVPAKTAKKEPEPQEDDFTLPDFDQQDVPVDESLDMPDFNMPDFDEPAAASNDEPLKFDDDEFKDPTFDNDPIFENDQSQSSSDTSFDSLYDENDIDSERKKTRLPVLVCLICAIICVLAVLLLLFVIPSRFNLLTSKNSQKEQVQEQVAPLPPPAQKEEPEPVAPPAKENEIVVVEEAEIVVPDLPKVEEKKAPKVITYKIKWGDTLWDISAAYYKNPWRYKKIAKYNGIKNPNHIVAGTTIKIPEE